MNRKIRDRRIDLILWLFLFFLGITIGWIVHGAKLRQSPNQPLTVQVPSEVQYNKTDTETIAREFYLKIETDYILIEIPQADMGTMSKQELRDVATFMALAIPGGRLLDGETVRLLAHKFVGKYICYHLRITEPTIDMTQGE